MRKLLLGGVPSAAFLMAAAFATAQPMGDGRPWGQWRQGPGWGGGPGMMGHGGMGYSPRRPFAMRGGIPEAYRTAANPLPQNAATIERGAKVYADNCASCHGPRGGGDGPAAKDLNPPPANLAWLAETPIGRWDPYFFWTISEGGAQFNTAMPAFKDSLSKDDIWAAVAYIQAQLPDVTRK